jgi:TonB-dependent receptor
MTMTGPGTFYNRMRRFDLGAEHDFGRLSLDYNAVYTQTNINGGGGGRGGVLINRITGVGWILDRTDSDLHPRFIQTEGPDFTNPLNYRPTMYTNNNQQADDEMKELRANARYELPVRYPTSLKVGGVWRERYVAQSNDARRWNYVGTSALPSDPSLISYDFIKTGRRMPMWENLQHFDDREPVNPALWSENRYFHEMTNYTGSRAVTEEITAGYVMAQGRVARTGWLTGVRTERTDLSSWGWVRARTPSTAAQQAADPVGAAERDYANTMREREGEYTKSFPSVHLTHDVTRNLKARLSWSTGFGRPALNNALPNETVNETQQTLTINNSNLIPQTTKNWDAALEYYFEPVGAVSVGWFHKAIKDYIVTGVNVGTVASGDDNGFAGEYSGFNILTASNAGDATVQGWEFTYQQQFTFLPGLLKGLGASANYTIITTHGNFGGAATLSTNEVQGFIPETGNASLSWRYRKFSARVLYNFTGDYITNYTAASVGRNRYRYGHDSVNVGVAYQYLPWLNFTVDIANLTNEAQRFYRGIPDQMETTIINGSTITFGVNGRF